MNTVDVETTVEVVERLRDGWGKMAEEDEELDMLTDEYYRRNPEEKVKSGYIMEQARREADNMIAAQQELRENNKKNEHETIRDNRYIDELRTELSEAKAVIQKLNEAILVVEIILDRERR